MFDPDNAACKGAPLELFYAPKGNTGNAKRAKRICNGCPVIKQCFDEAMSQDPIDDWGVWGGTTELERKKIRSMRHHAKLVAA